MPIFPKMTTMGRTTVRTVFFATFLFLCLNWRQENHCCVSFVQREEEKEIAYDSLYTSTSPYLQTCLDTKKERNAIAYEKYAI